MMCRGVLALVCSLALTCPSTVLAQHWPRFRGPNGAGTSEATTIPAHWTSADYHWRVELPGIGYSSPVVWGDRLFVTSGLEEDATQIIRCLRATDGGLTWERRFESTTHPKHQFNCYASSTPAVDADHVYYCFATPEKYTVLALDQQEGREAWRRDLGPFVAEHGFGASPMLFEGLVILPSDQDGESSIVALDRTTGETRWKVEHRTEKTAYATPCLYQPERGPAQLIVNSWAHGISSLDPKTGGLNWEQSVFRHRVVGSPAIAAGLIFGSCGGGGIGRQMIAVKPGNPATGVESEVAYEIEGSLPYVCTPVARGDLLFAWFDRGVVTCLDAPSGEIVWRERIGGEYFGSPVRVADRLYCISREGEMVVLAASRQFKEIARIDLEERSNSTPAVANGVMYLRTVSHVMAIGGEK
ncbi:MAG: PQQ-binding-like beta-propeller repeat protein [Planctomycetota bacterium]